LFLGALAILVIAGCAPKPDLEAVKFLDLETDPVAYCNLDDDGSLLVTVTNQGAAMAPETTTRVTFTTGTGDVVAEMRTPQLEINSSNEVDMGAVPANCYQADCFFTITVDAANEIDELDEENNSARGYCLG
jgi:hypothetical protein